MTDKLPSSATTNSVLHALLCEHQKYVTFHEANNAIKHIAN